MVDERDSSPPSHSPAPASTDTRPVTDRALLESWVGGAREAGDHLIARYYNQLVRHFRRNAPRADPLELTQDTFMQLCRSRSSAVVCKGSFRAYLYGIAQNVLRQHLRDHYRERELASRLAPLTIIDEQTPATTLMTVRRCSAILGLLAELPEASRKLLQAFYWDDRTAAQIGEELDVPAGTVRTRIYYGKTRLRDSFEDADDGIAEGDLEWQARQLWGLLCEGPNPAEARVH